MRLSLLEQARAYCGDTIPDKEVRELLGVVPDDALEELVGAIASGSADRALGLVHTFQKEGRNLQHFCREAIRHMRNLLIARVCGADSDLIAATPDQRPALAKAAAQFSEEDLTRFFQILLQTDDDLRRKPDPRVHLEMGLLRLINAARLAPLEELLAELKSGVPSGGTQPGMARGATYGISFCTGPSYEQCGSEHRCASAHASDGDSLASNCEERRGDRKNRQRRTRAMATVMQLSGISAEQVVEIKAAIQAQQKFLGELVDQSSRWELDGDGIANLFFAGEAAVRGDARRKRFAGEGPCRFEQGAGPSGTRLC